MEVLWYILILMAFSFFSRLIFGIGDSTDDYSHLWMVKERNRYRDLRQHEVVNTPLKGIRGYPPLAHFLIGFFPRRYWILAGKFLVVLYDCASVLIVFCSSYFVFRDFWHLEVAPTMGAFITALLYSSTPILFSVESRLKSIGARTLGGLFFTLYIVSFAAGHLYSSAWFYPPCVVLVLLTFITSQFATQNIIWVSIFLSIITLSFLPLILIASGLMLFLLPIFDGKKILYRKYSHFYHWFIPYLRKNKKNFNFDLYGRNSIKDLLLLPYHAIHNPRKAFLTFFHQNSFLIAAYSLPIVWVLLYLTVLHKNAPSFPSDWLLNYSFYLMMAALAVFILTSTRHLLFLGEAERYFEYASFPLNLLAVFLIFKFSTSPFQFFLGIFIINVTLVCILFIASNMKIFLSRCFEEKEPDLSELITFIKEIEKPKIITLPTKFAYTLSLFVDDEASYYFDNICHSSKGLAYMLDEYLELYYFIPSFEFFHEKYGIDTFVFSLKYLESSESKGVTYNLKELTEVFGNDTYWVGRYKKQ
ncbi:MAG: hypothetical protein KAS88_00135 [Deltaproteobacteria bacterium]|nr:hypothetical protein [Deltaproteobacteria bacterium]